MVKALSKKDKLFKALENFIYASSILLCEWVKMNLVVPDWVIYVMNVLLAIAAFLAYKYFYEARSKLRYLAELFTKLEKALEDARITEKEIEDIMQTVKKILLPEGE